MSFDGHIPTTGEVARRYQVASRNKFGSRQPRRETDAEFYPWLDGLLIAAVMAGMPTDPVRVFWYDCDCEWTTKYCDENHRRSALVPRGVLG